MPAFWWCKECPVSSMCSDAAWKRAKTWGWSKEEAISSVTRHLTSSSLHQLAHSDAEQLAELADYQEDNAEDTEEASQEHEQRASRGRKRAYDESGSYGGGSGAYSGGKGLAKGKLHSVATEAASAVLSQLAGRRRVTPRPSIPEHW